MSILENICESVENGKAKITENLVVQALEENNSAKSILDSLCLGMNRIGEKFKNNEVYVPEVLIAARAMNKGTAILKPYLVNEGVTPLGKAIICTVKGDMHDIGKNLVKMMLEGAGIECIDLGTDVSPETIVSSVNETGAQLVCLSALLTTTMPNQAEIVKALNNAGIRNKVKVLVGGAPVSQQFADEIGADYYTNDAASAAEVAVSILKNGI